MRPVEREDVLDRASYEAARPAIRQRVIAQKARRRIHVGSYLTFLFENRDTVHYQVQEMLRAEGTTDEAGIRHELRTYTELLGGAGELGCTLQIEIDDPLQRDIVLRRWRTLPAHLYALLPNGERARPTFDPRQIGDDRLSAVQFLRFPVGAEAPVALGVDAQDLGVSLEVALTDDQRAALAADLSDDQ